MNRKYMRKEGIGRANMTMVCNDSISIITSFEKGSKELKKFTEK